MSYTVNTNTNNICNTAWMNNTRSTAIRNRTLLLCHRTFAFNLYNVLQPFNSNLCVEKIAANIAVWRPIFEPFGVAISFVSTILPRIRYANINARQTIDINARQTIEDVQVSQTPRAILCQIRSFPALVWERVTV
jgi:hypothetical protein